jgi:hypothetical protein
MYAGIGRVKIKPDRADEALSMIAERGVAMLQGIVGSAGGYWARTVDGDEIIQHSFWLFDVEENARTGKRPSTGSATCPTRRLRSSVWMFARLSGRRPRRQRELFDRVQAGYGG